MPHSSCTHCGTTITHHETMQESAGKTYCCRNCLAMASGATTEGAGGVRCAHCESTIVDESTKVDRRGQMFCCENCADAVAAGATYRSN